jgi:hypothetical protein
MSQIPEGLHKNHVNPENLVNPEKPTFARSFLQDFRIRHDLHD